MEFEYRRKKGQQLLYRVKLLMTNRLDPVGFGYVAKVYRDEDFLGDLKRWPLQSATIQAAEVEARGFAEQDIEDLVGISE